MADVVPVQARWGQKTIPIKIVHSWSSLQQFENCPWQWLKVRHLKVVKDRGNEAMREGDERHRALELAVKGEMPLPAKYENDQSIVEMLRRAVGSKIVEWKFGITRNWTECDFFAPDVWVRGKIDVGVIGKESAAVFDYKTGKPKIEYDQLGLFAIPVFIRWPQLKAVRTAYIWLGERKIDPRDIPAAELPELKQWFGMRFARIEHALKHADTDPVQYFPKLPSGLCKGWCPVGREHCEFWSPKAQKD